VPQEGELTVGDVAAAIERLAPGISARAAETVTRTMPSRVPLCEGCNYTPLFEALITAMEAHGGRAAHIVVGETGCMVRGDLPPMELFDVKYGLGASLGMSLGIALNTRRQRVVCLVGDSAFFHSNLNALPQIVQAGADMTVIILDNRVTGLTGGQSHPGTPRDERGMLRGEQDIVPVLRAYGINPATVTPAEPEAMGQTLAEALGAAGPRFIVARVPCPRYGPWEEAG